MIDKKVGRSANLDLLRIVSMLLIILLHSIDHSGVLEYAPYAGRAMDFYVRFLYMLTQVCVNCYVMLSGYFLVTSKFRLQKLAALWLEVVFYSFVIKLGFMLAGKAPFSLLGLLSCLFPFITGRYWFITIYVGLYIIAPFLNIAIKAMDKRQHMMLNVVLLVLFSVINSIHPAFAGMNSGGGWGLAWFVVLYLISAWFRLYYSVTGKSWLYVLIWVFISLIVACLYCLVGEKVSLIRTVSGNWYKYNSLPAYLSTILLFLCFLNIQIRNQKISKAITYIAPSTLGVYLIHAHANFSPFLWEKLSLPNYMDKASFVLIHLGTVVLIFFACSLIDLIRRETIGRVESSGTIRLFCERAEKRLIGVFSKTIV